MSLREGSGAFFSVMLILALLSSVGGAQTAPTVSVIPPGLKEVDEGSLLTFTVDAQDLDSDPLTYMYYPGEYCFPLGASYDEGTEIFSWTPDYTQAGEYRFYLYVTDNKDGSAYVYVPITVHNVTVGTNVTPILSPIGNKSVNEGAILRFPVTATDANQDRLFYEVLNQPEGASFLQTDATAYFHWCPIFDQAGTYNLVFSASDGVFINGQAVQITVNEVNNSPTLDIDPTPPFSVDEDHLLEFSVDVSDSDADPTSVWCYPPYPFGFPEGATFDADLGQFSWTPTLQQAGEYRFYVLARDPHGGWAREQVTITVNDFVNPPTVTSATPPFVNSTPLSLEGNKDPNTSIWINGGQYVGLTASTDWSCTYPLSEGSNSLSITARNAQSTESPPTDVSTFLDTHDPIVSGATPEPYTFETRPTISANYSDGTGSGIDITSVTMLLDSTPVEGDAIVTSSGISYTPAVDLATGEHHVTVSVLDNAGNGEGLDWSFIIDVGTQAPPDEGTYVWAWDYSSYVYIPAGALSATEEIHVIPMDEVGYATGIPPNKALLSAVELLPNGLAFDASVTFGTSLTQAEIPGTELSLALFNPGSQTFEDLGRKMPVEPDGWWTKIEIGHFSVYGALKGLISTGAPLGGGVEIPLPDLYTGSFSHSIPLEVPPGRKEMQPSLQLLYRSSNRNGPIGYGWELNPGCIERSTKRGVPKYVDPPSATPDEFVFASAGSRMELVNLTANLFQAKIESGFVKFYMETDGSWRAVQKDGMVLYFGSADASRMTNPSGTFHWYLDKIVDPNGNYISLTYTKDQGQIYLSQIDYTGNEGTAFTPKHSVNLTYEARGDTRSSYITGAKVTTANRLSEVAMYVDASLAWRYVLTYSTSGSTNRSLLTGITRYGNDGTPFPSATMTYQTGGGP